MHASECNNDVTCDRLIAADFLGVIANNTKEFADHPNWRFEALDMISQSLTEAFDLVVAKEVLQHLTDPQVKCVLNNIKRSGSKYLLATSLDREEGW
jgi:2-polyprenyl-3-methyl-5-hydroxy-6-metoxy-1,4-benzoquinol methylase